MTSIADLIPYANNARTHTDDQVALIASSIKEFGFVNPVIIDEQGGIIAGHGRIMAAKKLGIEEVPTVLIDYMSDDQKKAYILADNRMALDAGWDDELLAIELGILQEAGYDLGLTGFNADELSEIFDTEPKEGETDDEETPEIPETATNKPGDIWILGNHRIMCGDSTSIDDAEKLMGGTKADMVWTDPPYNVNYEGQDGMTIENDHMDSGAFQQFLLDAFTSAHAITKAGRPIYVAYAEGEVTNFRNGLINAGFLVKQTLVWVKNSMVLGRQDYQWQHEAILYGWKEGEAHKWYGAFDKKTVIDDDINITKLDKKQLVQIINEYRNGNNSTVIREAKPTSNDMHPTMKPVSLIQRMIQNSSREEDIILDLFGGSGSTLIASEKLNRHARLMELDGKYADVIVERWQNFTGQQATHAETGKTFEEMKNDIG